MPYVPSRPLAAQSPAPTSNARQTRQHHPRTATRVACCAGVACCACVAAAGWWLPGRTHPQQVVLAGSIARQLLAANAQLAARAVAARNNGIGRDGDAMQQQRDRRRASLLGRLDPCRAPWFADVAPSLLTNRTIRRYLQAYSEHSWPEAIKLILIYGILGLEQQFPAGAPSLPELQRLVSRGGANLVVERNLPALQRQVLTLQSQLDDVYDKLALEALPAPTVAVSCYSSGRCQQQQQQQQQPAAALDGEAQQARVLEWVPPAPQSSTTGRRPRSAVNPNLVALKAPNAWRQGEPTGFPSPQHGQDQLLSRSSDNQGATNPIYPDWWMAPTPPPAEKQRKTAKAPLRQPRLAYSLQPGKVYSLQPGKVAPAPTAHDLATAAHLVMPSTGDAQQPAPPELPGHRPQATLTSSSARGGTTSLPPPQPGMQAAARSAAAPQRRVAPGTGAGRARSLGVQSKVGAALDAAGPQGAARAQQPQQVLVQEAPSRSSAASREAATACSAAAAVDQFLANPWAAWFMAAGAAGPTADADAAAAWPAATGSSAPVPQGTSALLSPVLEGGEAHEAAVDAAYGWAAPDARDDDAQPQLPAMAQHLERLSSAGSSLASPAAGPAADVLADITAGLNQQQPAAASTASSVGAAAGGRQQPKHAHHKPWAADFGHLENVDALPFRARSGSSQPHKRRWADTWVGVFDVHTPRAGPASDAARQRREAADTMPHSSDLCTSPTDLQQLVDAASNAQSAQDDSAAAGAAATAPAAEDAAAAAAAGAPAAAAGGDEAGGAPAAAAPTAAGVAAPAKVVPSSVQALSERFADVLARLNAQGQPAAAAAAEHQRAGVAVEEGALATTTMMTHISSGSDSGSSVDSYATGSTGREVSGRGSAAAAAHDSSTPYVSAGGAAAAAGGGADEGDAESYLEALHETSAMLQAALSRHDALMQLLSSMQARTGDTHGGLDDGSSDGVDAE